MSEAESLGAALSQMTLPLAVLGAGLGVAWSSVQFWRRRYQDAISSELSGESPEDLKIHAEHQIDVLKELEAQKERIIADDYQRLHAEVAEDAALALAQHQEGIAMQKPESQPQQSVASTSVTRPSSSPSPALAFGLGMAAMALLAGGLWAVSQGATQRQAGGSITGNDVSLGAEGDSAQAMPESHPHVQDPASLDSEIARLQSLLQQDPDKIEVLEALASRLLSFGLFGHARQHVDRLIALAPTHQKAQIWQAFFVGAEGSPEDGLKRLRTIWKQSPEMSDDVHVEFSFFEGVLAYANQDLEQTRTSWSRFVELAPEGARKEQVRAYLDGKHTIDREKSQEQAAQQGNSTARPRGPMAEIASLEEALKSDPENIQLLTKLTNRYLFVQQHARAKMLNDKVLSLEPGNVDGKVYAAVLQSASGDASGALSALDAVLKTYPKHADGWFFRGMLGMMTQQPELARESWSKFVAVAPDSPRKERIKGFLAGEGMQMPQ